MECFNVYGIKENKCVQTGAEKQARSIFLLYQNQTPANEFKIACKFCTKFHLNVTGKKNSTFQILLLLIL